MLSLMYNSKSKKHSSKKHSSKKHSSKKHSTKKHSSNKHSSKFKQVRGIEKYCKYFKNDINGKLNKNLYKSCKINKYCRKYKCNNIDIKFNNEQFKKLGPNFNILVLNSLRSECPITDEDNTNRNKCESKALSKFYKQNNMSKIYNKVIECDKKTCSKEKQIFNTNLFRQRQLKLKKKQKEVIDEDNFMEEADIEMIEKN